MSRTRFHVTLDVDDVAAPNVRRFVATLMDTRLAVNVGLREERIDDDGLVRIPPEVEA